VILLVSVADSQEAEAALEGGADIVDAKDPRAGALGPVALDAFRSIEAAVGGSRPVSAALGDASDERAIEQAARTYASHGAALVKIGFLPDADAGRIASLIEAAATGATAHGMATGVVAVEYADARDRTRVHGAAFADVCARAGAAGVMLDTIDKQGSALPSLLDAHALAAWVQHAHGLGLTTGLAGRLSSRDLSSVLAAGADVAAVRGAACEGGRYGRVTADLVRLLREPALFEPVGTSRL
jgi:uncharacterized protein (UPF0264 family)